MSISNTSPPDFGIDRSIKIAEIIKREIKTALISRKIRYKQSTGVNKVIAKPKAKAII